MPWVGLGVGVVLLGLLAVVIGLNRERLSSACCPNSSTTADGSLAALGTGSFEEIPTQLVFRSIGYTGRPIGDVPFDERRGLIRNEHATPPEPIRCDPFRSDLP